MLEKNFDNGIPRADDRSKEEGELLEYIKKTFGDNKEAAKKYLDNKEKSLLEDIEAIRTVQGMKE